MYRKVLVTGATGNIAGMVIPELLNKGIGVRAFVRSAEKGSDLADKGAEVCIGEFDDQDALNKAADGVDAVLAITPPNPDAVAQGEAIVAAAKTAGNPFYLRISAIGAAVDAPTENGRLHHLSDEALLASGLPYTILRPHFFIQNVFMSVDSIKGEGNMYLGMGDGKLGMIDVRDIADCCVSILSEGGHEGKIYTPTGPESISFHRVAEIISEGLGKQVNYIPVPIEAVGQAILDMGWGEWFAQVMMDYSKAYSEGWGDFTTDDVKTITGREPYGFQQFYNDVFSWALK